MKILTITTYNFMCRRVHTFLPFYLFALLLFLSSCSMTKNIPEDDQLFTGLKAITYEDYEENDNFIKTQEEVEAALATAPNGSLFGSSYYRVPFSFGVSVWNHYSEKNTPFARWMTKSFGKQPVLMSWVNPELRATVAQSVLRNHGYFNGRVDYEPITMKNPKTAKLSYQVKPGRMYTLDSVRVVGFPAETDSLIQATADETYVKKGDAFVVSNLDAERQRISTMLRNNGYYYYQPGYASYLADTFVVDGKVQLQLKLANDIPYAAKHKWYIGNIDVSMRKTSREVLTDSMKRRITIHFNGKKPPIRARVLMGDIKLRPHQLYRHDNYLQSMSKLNAMGLFSSVNMTFTPRDTTALCDTLDLAMTCTFDKPWNFYVETNFNARTIGRMGPELRMGVTRRNAFRGAEKIDVNVHGSYEWATSNSSSNMNNYEYGADASVEFPRIIAPFFGGNRVQRDSVGRVVRSSLFFSTPTTLAKASTDIIYRPGYYKMHVVSGEWTYRWQTSAQSRHEFSPLTVKYQFMNSHTSEFEELVQINPYLAVTMQDYFIPEMRYTYTYTSPSSYLHPIRWETTLAESGNGVALYDVLTGKSWNDKDKTMFKNPYSQFLKLETDFTKTWTLDAVSKLVGHINAGVIYSYGNSNWVPNSELFFVGGANSIRAFSVRGIGPGNFPGVSQKSLSYMLQNGDMKFVCNLEYRRQLFGSLYGAIFLDAGNVWNLVESWDSTDDNPMAIYDTKFQFKNLLKQTAVGTGIGIRYDMDFLVIRLDWGVALHYPFETSKSGFYNIERFKNSHTLHFAIGYPF